MREFIVIHRGVVFYIRVEIFLKRPVCSVFLGKKHYEKGRS